VPAAAVRGLSHRGGPDARLLRRNKRVGGAGPFRRARGRLSANRPSAPAPPVGAALPPLRGPVEEAGGGLDEGLLRKAYFATRVIPRKQYDCILRLLIVFAEHLSSLTNQLVLQGSGAELPVVTLARTFIKEHHTEELSLTVVARAVHMSPFYFCKVFRRETGLTFTDYLARMRVESVKTQLLVPHMYIGEAAFACGFQSLSSSTACSAALRARLRRHSACGDAGIVKLIWCVTHRFTGRAPARAPLRRLLGSRS